MDRGTALPPRRRRTRMLVLAGGAVVLLVAAVGIGTLLGGANKGNAKGNAADHPAGSSVGTGVTGTTGRSAGSAAGGGGGGERDDQAGSGGGTTGGGSGGGGSRGATTSTSSNTTTMPPTTTTAPPPLQVSVTQIRYPNAVSCTVSRSGGYDYRVTFWVEVRADGAGTLEYQWGRGTGDVLGPVHQFGPIDRNQGHLSPVLQERDDLAGHAASRLDTVVDRFHVLNPPGVPTLGLRLPVCPS